MRPGVACLLPVACCALACNARDDLDGRRKPIAGLKPPGQELHLAVESRLPAWDLHDNRASAVVHSGGGLAIECGTADFAKYVEGSYRSHWFLSAEDSGRRVALIDGLAGALYLPLDRDPVPPKYSEKTRLYYERLGSGE